MSMSFVNILTDCGRLESESEQYQYKCKDEQHLLILLFDKLQNLIADFDKNYLGAAVQYSIFSTGALVCCLVQKWTWTMG